MNRLVRLWMLAFALVSCGCAHFFEGTVAELDEASDVTVVLTASSYGDCYRLTRKVPIVYAVARPQYSVRIAHGMRYWPEFFLVAHDRSGAVLAITGDGIGPVPFPRGGDMRRLTQARGTDLSHYALLD